jgi:murein DD-endopeptidase MepM/ murein hydrolase activator NlpD
MNIRLLFLCLMILPGLAACGHTPAPVIDYGQSSGAGSAGIHTVSSGDTLYSISGRYRLPMRDIVALNNINPPFRLYVGQRIKLPPPQEYRVSSGDTLYGVSRLFGVNSSEVARLNGISAPYALRVGQTLRLPSVIRQSHSAIQVASVEKSALKAEVYKQALASPQPIQKPTIIKDGVPIPQGKPVSLVKQAKAESIKISKVNTQAPKRSSSKFLKPVNGKIISDFGAKKSGLHNDGINIAAQRGAPVISAENGVVVYAGNALKGSGNLILVRHDNRWMSAYGHLDQINVRKGQVIKRGSVIGKVGSTGSVSTPQLHFELRRGTSALNPVRYM